jgi:DNA-binding CsgD family transcriptional regulator
MHTQAFTSSIIYNDIDKVQHYRPYFKPVENSSKLHKEKWEILIPFLEQVSFQNCVQVLLWNVSTNRYVYEVDKREVAGYDASLYLADNGVDFSMSNCHPFFSTAVFILLRRAFKYLLSNKQAIYNTVINFDFQYKRGDGAYMHCLQQITCIDADDIERPILLLNCIHDITYIKKEHTSNLVITAPGEVKWWSFNFDTNYMEPVQPLSRQEKLILTYLANSKSSKEIAKELFISPHTIDTHRRHLLHKTNCLDTTGMITYTKLVGLL